jgi:hypothetical protein
MVVPGPTSSEGFTQSVCRQHCTVRRSTNTEENASEPPVLQGKVSGRSGSPSRPGRCTTHSDAVVVGTRTEPWAAVWWPARHGRADARRSWKPCPSALPGSRFRRAFTRSPGAWDQSPCAELNPSANCTLILIR